MLNKQTKNYRLLIILAVLVVAMFGFGFALVPLYTLMCQSWGINGKTDGAATARSVAVDTTRTITVEFVSNTNTGLPWDFYPLVKKIQLHPGENKVINYYARNNSNHTMTVQAIPSISPGPAAKHLKKTECFCFTQQTFKAHEGREMPVLFHIDTDLPKNIHIVTLSYTMFNTAELMRSGNNKTPGRIQ
jgi:cytochrome c oxidase assembly protein subunit 11